MPPKPPLDDNTRFLWQCLYNSDYKNIDFPGVAKFFGLNTPAARMRFSRLKRQLEQEALSDGEELPERRPAVVQPRKRKRSKRDNPDGQDGHSGANGVKMEDGGGDGVGVKKEEGVEVKMEEGVIGVTGGATGVKVKKEVDEGVGVKMEENWFYNVSC